MELNAIALRKNSRNYLFDSCQRLLCKDLMMFSY